MPDFPSREVVHEHEFEEQLAALIPDVEAADEFTAAACEILAADPLYGLPASRDGAIWQLAMPPIGDRTVTLYYTFDARTVTLFSIVAF